MKKTSFIILMLAAMLLASCGTASKVPVTGRTHRLSVTDEYMLSLSTQQYGEYMKKAKPSTNQANTAMVKRVGQRLANAVETYLRNHGFANEVKNFKWEFNLVQDQQVNAFCMPGGKIVVYEGILPVTRDEASLAIVLGHEIAHAVAKHSAEQLSKAQRAQTGLAIGGAVLSSQRERGRPHGTGVCCDGRIRPCSCGDLLAAYGSEFYRYHSLMAQFSPERCKACQGHSGMAAGGTAVLQRS